MKCHYCGTEIPGSEKFCRFCGTRQETVPEPEAIAEPAVEPVIEPPMEPADEPAVEPKAEPAEEPAAPAIDPYEFPMPKKAPVFDEDTFSWKPTAEKFSFESFDPAPESPAKNQPVQAASSGHSPRIQLPAERSLLKMVFLGIITLGIYPTVIWSRIVTELNIAASRHDGRRTMPYLAMVILTPLTLGIYTLVWMHGFCSRISRELARRNIDYKFNANTFWLWNVLGSLILVGPFVFVYKLTKAMNQINADFNING